MNSSSPPEASGRPNGLDFVVRRLSAEPDLAPQDLSLVSDVCRAGGTRAAGADLTGEAGPLFLASGWACRIRALEPHGRQVLGFVLPGDPIALGDADQTPAHRTLALTRVSLLDGRELAGRLSIEPDRHQGLAVALDRAERAEHRRHLDHAVRLGALSAYQAMLHFLSELHDRLALVGLAKDGRFDLPVAQDALAVALGISEVHANRVLAQLRRDGALKLGPGWAALPGRA